MPLKSDLFCGEFFNSAKKIILTLQNQGHKAFFVGGCVRDALLKLEPKEFDIATSATPGEVQKIFNKTVPVGESFGVILVLDGELKFEVATFRKEEDYLDGRHPSYVEYSKNEQEDVIRRDFTINGLLYDPVNKKLLDYVGGEKDIKSGVIKTIGSPESRFLEDKLRMIRAVRFASRFDFKIDVETMESIKKLASEINQVSPERIRDEIIKISTQKNPGNGLKLLAEAGLLKHTIPDIEKMIGVEQPPEFHPEGDVFIHTCMVLDKLHETTGGDYSPELAIGALLHDVGKPPTFEKLDRIRFNGHDRVGAEMAEKICKELRFSNKQIQLISDLIRDHLKFKDVTKMRESTLKRFISKPHFDQHLKLHLADCLASHGIMEAYDFIKDKLEEFKNVEIRPLPLINGKDLIKIGYEPGPIFSEIISKVEEQQLEGLITNKEDAMDFVKREYKI